MLASTSVDDLLRVRSIYCSKVRCDVPNFGVHLYMKYEKL